ncbi:tetratricopeptide repeat protein [Hyalangium sp.]|uniref:tetratricopeptide repeat protein n=1 Tax=Hyalangium sp. TaxID=2028555 RepID=UPI002D221977|nr:tetratricopeptide repeat protein [Hyalangium sp.]HYH95657.1 tetratricopeptide repeat protein [Hyalangium sp.]
MEASKQGTPVAEGSEAQPPFLLEEEKRLSRSLLWELQRRYYDGAGIDAWSTATVPHHVTNNPSLAQAYAEIFIGYLRDCRSGSTALDPSEPVTIMELGAGSGRFAYLFLKALTEMLQQSPMGDVKFRYVMTDFTETNLRFWRGHPSLRPFVERGVLDFALFDAEVDEEIRLIEAGVTIRAGSLKNPLGVIANYVFDGIRQDAFSFRGGELYECLISLSTAQPVADLEDPALIKSVSVSYTHKAAPAAYYEEQEFNEILRNYAQSLEQVTILFPHAAIHCIRRLAALSGGRLLVLSADYGETQKAAQERREPWMSTHGSFSMAVNYHAIAEYVLHRNGAVLKTAHRHAYLAVAAFLLGGPAARHPETRLAYELAVGRGGPDDLFSLWSGLQGGVEKLGIEPVLSLIRLSRWDPRILQGVLPALWNQEEGTSAAMREEVLRMVMRVWEHYYPIGEKRDLAFELAMLVYAYGGYTEALGLFQDSLRSYGSDARAWWNMGLCHFGLEQPEEALRCFGEAARLDPGFRPRGALQAKEG